MSTEPHPEFADLHESPRRPIPEAAKRALAEAAARKAVSPAPLAKEYNGRQGPDPVRYGDWEVKGLACDF